MNRAEIITRLQASSNYVCTSEEYLDRHIREAQHVATLKGTPYLQDWLVVMAGGQDGAPYLWVYSEDGWENLKHYHPDGYIVYRAYDARREEAERKAQDALVSCALCGHQIHAFQGSEENTFDKETPRVHCECAAVEARR